MFETQDLYSAIYRLCHTKRAEGETAFPDLATIEHVVKDERRKRLEVVSRVRDGEERKHHSEHPEEYISLQEIYDAVAAKRAAEMGDAKPRKTLLDSLEESQNLSVEQKKELRELLQARAERRAKRERVIGRTGTK